MKIRTDLAEIIPQKNLNFTPPPKIRQGVPAREKKLMNAERIQVNPGRLQQERTLADALAIAQISQSLIQKAIVVSGRLKNIASEALFAGKVDVNELSNVISDMNTAFMKETGAAISQTTFNPVTPPVPRIDEEVNALTKFAQNMKQGGEIRMQDIAAVLDSLNNKSAAAKNSVHEIKSSLGNVLSGYPKSVEADYGTLAGTTANAILSNTDQALAAQGNIRRDTAKIVMS